MKIFLALSFLVLSYASFAHEPNEAFFEITQKGNTTEVIAEFPWTLRNALIEFYPSLETANSKRWSPALRIIGFEERGGQKKVCWVICEGFPCV